MRHILHLLKNHGCICDNMALLAYFEDKVCQESNETGHGLPSRQCFRNMRSKHLVCYLHNIFYYLSLSHSRTP